MDLNANEGDTILAAMSTSLPGSGESTLRDMSVAARRSSLFGPTQGSRGSTYFDPRLGAKRRASAWLMEQLTTQLEQNKRRRTSSTNSDLLADLSPHDHLKARAIAQHQMDWNPIPIVPSSPRYSTAQDNRRRSRRLSNRRSSLLDPIEWGNLLGSADYNFNSHGAEDQPQRRRFSYRVAAQEFGVATPAGGSAAISDKKEAAAPSSTLRRGPKEVKAQKRSKLKKRASNRNFEARRRNRVAAALKQLKTLCLAKDQQKKATKITILEAAVAALQERNGEEKMDFEAAYAKAEQGKGSQMSKAAVASGAADQKRSIRERRRRLQTNILEAELARLALPNMNKSERKAASKCIILDKVCVALGGVPIK